MSELVPRRGDYRKLKSFQTARLVYDCTVAFCDKYIDKRSRTHDQEELILDYEDYLRQHSLPLWSKDDQRSKRIRAARLNSLDEFRRLLAKSEEWTDESDISDDYKGRLRQERGANAVICLIRQATYLLSRQLEYWGRNFLDEGGFTERMYKLRSEQRKI